MASRWSRSRQPEAPVWIALALAASVAAFVLASLVLFAGMNPGFMEDHYILMFNTSELGQNLIPTPTIGGGNSPSTTTGSGGGGIGGFFSSIYASATAAAASAAGAVESDLAKIEDDIADKLARELGIEQFYTLHVLDLCEGFFTPNATAPGAGYNVTNCTAPLPASRLNFTAVLDHELSIGPLKINLADLKFPGPLSDKLNQIPGLLLALAIIYILGMALAGLSILTALPAFFVAFGRPLALLALANLAITGLSAVCLLAGDLAITIVGRQVVDKVNEYGHYVGLVAVMGDAWLRLAWAAFACVVVAAGVWAFECAKVLKTAWRRRGGGRRSEKDAEGERARHSRERI